MFCWRLHWGKMKSYFRIRHCLLIPKYFLPVIVFASTCTESPKVLKEEPTTTSCSYEVDPTSAPEWSETKSRARGTNNLPTLRSSRIFMPCPPSSRFPRSRRRFLLRWPPSTEEEDHDYDSYMNSPGIRATALLKRMWSVGTPSQFSLGDYTNRIYPPPLVAGVEPAGRARSDGFRPSNFGSSTLYSFDSSRSQHSTALPYTLFVTMAPRTGHEDEIMETHTRWTGGTEEGATMDDVDNSCLTEVWNEEMYDFAFVWWIDNEVFWLWWVLVLLIYQIAFCALITTYIHLYL